MKKEHAEEFTQSLGQIIGGSWRQIALADKLGVPKALGLSTQEWVQKRLGGYASLSISDRKKAVTELVLVAGLSQRKAAEIVGVGQATVHRDLIDSNESPNGKQSTKIDSNESFKPGTPAAAALAAIEAKIEKNEAIRRGLDKSSADFKKRHAAALVVEALLIRIEVTIEKAIRLGEWRDFDCPVRNIPARIVKLQKIIQDAYHN